MLLASGKLGRTPPGEIQQPHKFQRHIDPLFDHVAGQTPFLEAKGNVLAHRHMGPEGITLKHHPQVAPPGRQIGHFLIPDDHPAGLSGFEARN